MSCSDFPSTTSRSHVCVLIGRPVKSFKPSSSQTLSVSYRRVDPYADVLPPPSPAVLADMEAGYLLPLTCGLEPLAAFSASDDCMWSKITGAHSSARGLSYIDTFLHICITVITVTFRYDAVHCAGNMRCMLHNTLLALLHFLHGSVSFLLCALFC